MKAFELPMPSLGVDLVSLETSLPDGAVRRATNITIERGGGFQMRPGHSLLTALPGAHSLWRSPVQTRVLVAAGETLYDVDLPSGSVAPIFVGLPPLEKISYEDVGTDIYFTCRGVMRKIALDGSVRVPGVCELAGDVPDVAETLGGLFPGRYGVAYSLVNDLGEESPISGTAWIDLPTGGGIMVSAIESAADVVSVNLYVTSANGDELYHHSTSVYAATASITDQRLQKIAALRSRQILPSGNIVRHFNGRLYVVDGKWIRFSDPLNYGVSPVVGGFMGFKRTITMFEPVRGGIFVGMRERTLFLQGSHEGFVQIPISQHGALSGSCKVPADYFNEAIAPNRTEPVAVWLSDIGLAVGRPDGTVAYPQQGRICGVSGGDSSTLFALHEGIKQVVFCVDSMVSGSGGAADSII